MAIQIRTTLAEPETGQSFVPHRPARPPKAEGGRAFKIVSEYTPAGDQPGAIAELVAQTEAGERDQVLLGVTGSGKTFTMAKVIEAVQRPALILAPNKILAAQLYGEMKSFFPDNAVEYFVSYYDYYQPEAYVPRSDTYIEKESSTNESIDRMRHSATRALLERDDVIIVASVSCLYGIGSVETYSAMIFDLKKGQSVDQREIVRKLVALQYKRNDMAFQRGNFRVKGDTLEIFPSHYEDTAWRVSFFGDDIEEIVEFDPLTGKKVASLDYVRVYANSHYVTPGPTLKQAMEAIKFELAERLKELVPEGKLLEAQRLEQRTNFDLEMIAATGSCAGIENYSRFLTGRMPGEPPPTLFEYLPDNALLFVDESHVTIGQINGMSRGDHRRKLTLAEYGFRLPSAIDNRPLRFNEWEAMRPQTTYVSATPGDWEMEQTGGVFAEQVIRPTGLIDPPIEIKPVEEQVQDLIVEARKTAEAGYRTLVTTLTKRMAEDLTEFMHEAGNQGPLHALGRRDAGADRADPRPAAGRVRRAGRHQSAARGARYPRMRAGRDPGCRQGGLPPIRNIADPDDRPRGAQRRRARDPLCRPYHRIDGPGDERDRAACARSSWRITRRMASRRRRSAATSATSSRTCRTATRLRSTSMRTGHTWSATICARISRTSKSRCAPRPPTWSSRPQVGCATRSARSSRRSLACRPTSRRRR